MKKIETPEKKKEKYEKFKSYFIDPKHSTSSGYSQLFRQFSNQTKTIYKNAYIELTSRYSIVNNGDKEKLIKILLRFTNISQVTLSEVSAKIKPDSAVICKPSEINIVKLPPTKFLIQ